MGTGCQRSSTLSTVDQQTSHLQVWKGLESSDGNVRFPFKAGSSSVMISIEVHEFCSLLDSGAAVTVVNAEVWQTYLHHHAHLNFKSLELESVTSVDGLNSQIFRFEAFFLKYFSYDVENSVIFPCVCWNIFTHKFSCLTIFNLFKSFHFRISKNIEKPL